DTLEDSDAQIRRAFANRRRAKDVLELRLARGMRLLIEHEMGKKSANVVLDSGTCSILPTSFAAAEIVDRLDGKKTLRKLGADKRAAKLCRELLELGALKIVD
ncbi:MAG TPA: hypothetical protein VGG88_04600, partial [Gaiellaceae bacterium]